MTLQLTNGFYIPNEDRTLFPFWEWMQGSDPERAQTVVLISDFGMLEVAKEDIRGAYNFQDAQAAAALYRKGFRCPTLHEAIVMYDARFQGLNEVLRSIGGQPLRGTYWTSVLDPNPMNTSIRAFMYYSETGNVVGCTQELTNAVRPVSIFKK